LYSFSNSLANEMPFVLITSLSVFYNVRSAF
jgi:hypothetical protein